MNPLQVLADNDAWNQPGDWMDVVLSQGVYRQHLADHAGTVIVHCHWLSHEELGCMTQFSIGTCETDDVANGILETCSTDETLDFLTLWTNELGWSVWVVTTLFVLAIVLGVAAVVVLPLWCCYRKKQRARISVDKP